jgi:hypothetical protein
MPQCEVLPGITRSCLRRGNELWLNWRGWYRTSNGHSIGIEVEAHSFYVEKTMRRLTEVEAHVDYDGSYRCWRRNQVSVNDLITVRNWVDYLIGLALDGLPHRSKLIVKAEWRDGQKDVRRRLYRRWGKRWEPYTDVVYDW